MHIFLTCRCFTVKPTYSEDITLRRVKISEIPVSHYAYNLYFIWVFLQLIRKFANMDTINKCMMNLDNKRHHKFAFSFMIFPKSNMGCAFSLFPKTVCEICVNVIHLSFP
jgi:hypothetical protein